MLRGKNYSSKTLIPSNLFKLTDNLSDGIISVNYILELVLAIYLILGGARSGKSAYAEQLAAAQNKPVAYLATALADDPEMQARIRHHQAQRPTDWQTIEVGENLAQTLAGLNSDQCVIIDCLTLWLMACFAKHPVINQTEIDSFLQQLANTPTDLLIVSNEISMGVVPMGVISREYVDTLGRLHQQIAAMAEQVTLMVAGIPLQLK